MKRYTIYLIFFNAFLYTYPQEFFKDSYIDINYVTGNIALHNNDILHLISGRPEGLILSWNKKTFGDKAWQERYNFPDYGISYIYQDLKNEYLGDNHGIYAHYNFYFFKRKLMFRIGQGLAYTTSPFHKSENPKNIAFGSQLLSSTYVMLNYKQPFLFNRLGFQVGLSLIHYSNANVKAPNTSINSIGFNAGLNYNFDEDRPYKRSDSTTKFKERIKYNVVFRSGINESDLVGSGQFPFYILSAYADKRLNHKSALQLGTDVFFSNFLKEYIRFKSIAFINGTVKGDEDFKRIGIFTGHELFINKLSIISQLGYYVYYPVDFEGRVYLRAGLKRYFGDKIFGAVTLKSHGARAEAVEFGVGIRL